MNIQIFTVMILKKIKKTLAILQEMHIIRNIGGYINMYYTLIKHKKNDKIYYIFKRTYYSRIRGSYTDASSIFLDEKEYITLKKMLIDNDIKFKEFNDVD